MSEECQISNNDLVLYLSVLTVLVLIFPLLDLLIIRVTWLYKDEFALLPWGKVNPLTRQDSYFSRARTVSSMSTRDQHVHPMQRTAATLVFSNEDSRDDSPDPQRRREDSIVYGKSYPRNFSVRGAEIEETSRFIRSAAEVNLKSKFAEKRVLPDAPPEMGQRRTATRIEALTGIESPATRDVSSRRRVEKISAVGDVIDDMFENYNVELQDRVTLVTPVSGSGSPTSATRTGTGYQSSEFIERLAGTSLLYQEVTTTSEHYVHSRTNLIDPSSRGSTPEVVGRKLLSRPDNTRRKVNRLGTTHSPDTSPK